MDYQLSFKSEEELRTYFDNQRNRATKEHRDRIMKENIRYAQELRLITLAERKATIEHNEKENSKDQEKGLQDKDNV